MSHSVVDLFCGTGGLTHGFINAGLNVVAGIDVETSCSYSYAKNNSPARFHSMDVTELSKQELEQMFSSAKVKVLAGCAPCQPFSTYTQAKDKSTDTKWPLLYQYSRLIKEVNPQVVTMENVPNVVKHKVYHDFVDDLKKQGYFVWEGKVECKLYGVPQQRVRHVLLASLFGEISLIPPTVSSPVTVKEAIGSLPEISDGETSKTDPLHRASKLSDLNKQRIIHSVPGGTWRDWPEHLLAECHKKATGKGYGGVYGRMSWNLVAPTITTLCYGYGNGRFGHPEQNRGLSLREAAMLQSFPKDYIFNDPKEDVSLKSVGRMIGNAVPVKLAEAIGLSIKNHIDLYH
jgi:DNA (cytosine-5)-methyltransferase 1